MEEKEEHQRKLSAGARLGIWLGSFGWLIAFVLVTLPDTLRFAGPIAGGCVLTFGIALGLEWVARRTLPGQLPFSGALVLAIGLLCLYHSLVVEPVILKEREIVRRLEALGSVITVPLPLAIGVTCLGLLLMIAGFSLTKGVRPDALTNEPEGHEGGEGQERKQGRT